jgi:hypothetical protein
VSSSELSPSEWARITDIFTTAAELVGPARVEFLDRECGPGSPLRGEIVRLLGMHERDSGPLDGPLFPASGPIEEEEWAGHLLAGRYAIERLIARGGTASVFLAHDRQLAGRPVIVKFLHTWARQFSSARAKFRQEMEALARIDHPAVVGVLDAGETSAGLPYLVIEYVDGVTLRAELRKGPLDATRVARTVRETGKAAAAAHASGVVHRDIKLENLMLEAPGTNEERVRLIDFGIARLDWPEPGMATQITQFAGTTAYMAPEQLRGRPIPASDIYAIGVLAYEMLAGVRPFAAASPVELYEQQRSGAQAAPLYKRRDVSERAVRAILTQLSFRPEDRCHSALDAGEEIARALLKPGSRIWRRRYAASVLLSGAVAIGAGGYLRWRWNDEDLTPAGRDRTATGNRTVGTWISSRGRHQLPGGLQRRSDGLRLHPFDVA